MKNLFVWNTFMQWKPVAIKEQKVTENQAGSDDATTDVNQQTAGVQIADQANQGLSYEERWKIIQYFSDWIKNADVRIQMLLAVQGFIVAAYGALIPATEKADNFWNLWTILFTVLFIVFVLISFIIGFLQFPNTTSSSSKENNIFFYGSYVEGIKPDGLSNFTRDQKLEDLGEQLVKLGQIASKKFKNVQHLQTSVFLSSFSLALLLVGFTPDPSKFFREEWMCTLVIVVCIILCSVIFLCKLPGKNVK